MQHKKRKENYWTIIPEIPEIDNEEIDRAMNVGIRKILDRSRERTVWFGLFLGMDFPP